MFELSTSISNLRHLADSDLGPYDAVYLGNLYCRRYEANLLERPGELCEAIRRVHDQGRRAYAVTYASTRNDVLPVLRRALEVAANEGAEAVEVHAPGVLKLVHDEFPSLPLHVGSFANVYTDLGVEVMRRYGVARIAPNHELPLEEIDALARAGEVPLELVLHGKMPLGVSEFCFLLDYEAMWGVRCPDLCQKDIFLRREDWAMKSVGKGILSGRDVCMLEHLPRVLAAGHRHFRIEALSEGPAYRREVGAVYREALTRALAGDHEQDPRWWEILRRRSNTGLCNGFYFGRSGMEYVSSRPDEAAPFRVS